MIWFSMSIQSRLCKTQPPSSFNKGHWNMLTLLFRSTTFTFVNNSNMFKNDSFNPFICKDIFNHTSFTNTQKKERHQMKLDCEYVLQIYFKQSSSHLKEQRLIFICTIVQHNNMKKRHDLHQYWITESNMIILHSFTPPVKMIYVLHDPFVLWPNVNVCQ